MEPLDDGQTKAEEFAAAVAHDLRNPLGCIQGYAEMLAHRDMPAGDRERIASRILSASRFMEQIIEDLLDAEAIVRGSFSLKPAPVAVADVLGRAVASIEHQAQARGATLRLTLGALDGQAWADAARLQQVAQNLVANALKHVTAGSGVVDVRLHEGPDTFAVEVTDNGEGIAPEHLERIFEKFFRADGALQGSLGLGLHIARSIVEAHGGRLWARSDGPGRGASFFFTLPKYDPDRAFAEYKRRCRAATPPPSFVPGELGAPVA